MHTRALQTGATIGLVAALATAAALTSNALTDAARGAEDSVAADPNLRTVAAPYAGTAACAECHKQEFTAWRDSSHAHSFERATDENMPPAVVKGEPAEHPPGTTNFQRDGKRYIAETLGPDGEPTPYELTYVAGRMRIRMFIATLPDGRLQVLPSMLEAPTGRWFDYTHLLFGGSSEDWDTPPVVAPGEASFWTGADRSWDARCSGCHTSGRRAAVPDADGNGPRSTWRALGIDCEECHGPGLAHTNAWRDLDPDAPGAALARLEKLPRVAATAVCTRCHMESEIISARFTIGDDLYDHADPTLLLDPERVDPSGRALELIYDGLPFSVSECANEGGLTCRDCHEPHGGKIRSQLRAKPGEGGLCVRCHEDIGTDLPGHTRHKGSSSGTRCVSCHMPFVAVERHHGAVADHSISIPRINARGDRVAQDACTWCHTGGIGAPEDAPQLDKERVAASFAEWWPDPAPPAPWMEAIAAARLGEPDAVGQLVAVITDRDLAREIRASAVRLLARYPDDGADAILAATNDPESLVRRSAVTALAALPADVADAKLLEALTDDEPAVRFAAARASLLGWTRVRKNHKLLDAIIPVFEEETRIIPDDHKRWFRLGAARSLAGDKVGALAAYEMKLRLDPLAHAVRRQVERLREELAK